MVVRYTLAHSPNVVRARRGSIRSPRRTAVIPPDPSAEIPTVEKELARIRRQREDLSADKGPLRRWPLGGAVWELGQADGYRPAEAGPGPLRRIPQGPSPVPRRARRLARAPGAASRAVEALAAPEASRLDAEEAARPGVAQRCPCSRTSTETGSPSTQRPSGVSTTSPGTSTPSTNACNVVVCTGTRTRPRPARLLDSTPPPVAGSANSVWTSAYEPTRAP